MDIRYRKCFSHAGAVLLLAIVCALAASSASARRPSVQVYFDSLYTDWWTDCQGCCTTSYLYVVAENLNTSIRSIEYAVAYPPAVTHLVDLPVPNTSTLGPRRSASQPSSACRETVAVLY